MTRSATSGPLGGPSLNEAICTRILAKEVTAEAINAALRAASEQSLYGILAYETEPIVSSDILHSTYEPSEPLRYFHNERDGTFRDVSFSSGVAAMRAYSISS